MNKKLGSTLIAMTIIIFMLFLTLGMFTKNFGGSAKAEVAKPYASIVGETLSHVDTDNNQNSMEAGSEGEYTFSVKNTDKKDGNKVSEVAMSYSLYVETADYDESNVEYKLIDVDNNNIEITTKDSDGWYTDSNMNFNVSNGTPQAQVHQYKLVFTPSEGDQDLKFKVKVKAQQID